MTRNCRGRRGLLRGCGFTIVECLVGLAISAILLAAVAAAFSASLTNYRENERMFWALNNARQALTRMTSEIRTGYPVDLAAPLNQCSFFTAANEDITYDFRADEQKLYLWKNTTGQKYVLCDNVKAARFDKTWNSEGTDCRSVQISLTVAKGGFEKTLAGAAVVRRCPP
jgi:prepilin-type N-terminal cleavage/methylation domain-containing protein